MATLQVFGGRISAFDRQVKNRTIARTRNQLSAVRRVTRGLKMEIPSKLAILLDKPTVPPNLQYTTPTVTNRLHSKQTTPTVNRRI